VLGVVSAGTTIFRDSKLLGCVGFIPFGDIVEMSTFGAFQTYVLSGSFFSHSGDILAQKLIC